jgi:hypothetical protein
MQDICVTFIMKKHAGRPKVGTQNAKGVFISVRFTPPEGKRLNEAIRRAQQSKSEWIRQTLLAAADDNKAAA